MEKFDSQTFKTQDAASYDRLTEQFDYFTEQLSQPLAAHLIRLAEIAPGEKILDVGTGTGVVALQAARNTGKTGMICGIDLSEEMLNKASSKAKELQIEERVNFIQMDAESLDFDDETFDCVVSLFALLHFPNPLTALKEIHRVLRPGGRIVLAVGSGIPIFSANGWLHIVKRLPNFFDARLGKNLEAPQFLDSLVNRYISDKSETEESDLAARTRHNRAPTVASLVRQAGFEVLKTDWHGHREVINSAEEFWEIQRTFSSIARKRLAKATAAELDSLRNTFFEKCLNVQTRGGRLIYPFGAFYVAAHRP